MRKAVHMRFALMISHRGFLRSVHSRRWPILSHLRMARIRDAASSLSMVGMGSFRVRAFSRPGGIEPP